MARQGDIYAEREWYMRNPDLTAMPGSLWNPLARKNDYFDTTGDSGPGYSGPQSNYAQANPGAYFRETGTLPEEFLGLGSGGGGFSTGNIYNPDSGRFDLPSVADAQTAKERALQAEVARVAEERAYQKSLRDEQYAHDMEKTRIMYPADRYGQDAGGGQGRGQYYSRTAIDPQTGLQMGYSARTNRWEYIIGPDGNKIQGRVEPTTMTNPSAGERKDIGVMDSMRDKISRVRNLYKPEYSGLVQGQVGRVSGLGNAEERMFREYIDVMKDDLLRAKSGAQINEQEYARLIKFMPNYNLTDTAFMASLNRLEEELEIMRKNKINIMNQTGTVAPDQLGANSPGQGNIYEPENPASPQSWKPGQPPPRGFKTQTNKFTGETRLVPIQ